MIPQDPDMDTRRWCRICEAASTEHACFYCGSPLTSSDSGVRLHERGALEAEVRAYQLALANRRNWPIN